MPWTESADQLLEARLVGLAIRVVRVEGEQQPPRAACPLLIDGDGVRVGEDRQDGRQALAWVPGGSGNRRCSAHPKEIQL